MERIGDGPIMGRSDELLFFLGQASRVKRGTDRKHPGASIRYIHAKEDIRQIFFELRLHGRAMPIFFAVENGSDAQTRFGARSLSRDWH
jgi:hypothetical protein